MADETVSSHRIGVIADTHIPGKGKALPEAALRLFDEAAVELILHAGDISSLAVINQLEAYAPVEAVQGNAELPEVVRALPLKRELMVGGCAIGLIHDLGQRTYYARNARREFPSARVVIFGHSHTPLIEEHEGLLLLNPGSATDRRRQPRCSVALLTIADGAPSAEIVMLP